MGFTRGNHVVVRRVLLQHQPHRFNVVAGKAPVAFGVEVAKAQFLRQAELDASDAISHLACDELSATPWAFMVEQDAGNAVHVVAFTIVHRDPVAIDLGHPIRATRIERRLLALRHSLHFAEHLARRGLIEADAVLAKKLDCFEHTGHADGRKLARQAGLLPTRGNETLGGEVVDFRRIGFFHHVDNGELVQ